MERDTHLESSKVMGGSVVSDGYRASSLWPVFKTSWHVATGDEAVWLWMDLRHSFQQTLLAMGKCGPSIDNVLYL